MFSDLRKVLESYLGRREVADIYRAYLFGEQVHAGQTRRSGEPYISHPLEVARLLAEMHLDAKGIMAALLHDVIEDTPTAKDQIAKSFGEEVAQLVDGVSKLTQIQFQSQAEAQAENFRKMLMAMAHDIRVILIKLADRLHNMRTLGAMPPEKRRRIARETLEIYAPIANRLGMNRLRLELEDLGFAWLYPMRCRILAEAVKRARGNRKEFVHTVETSINRRLRQEGLGGRVIGREKHLYGIYLKMHNKHLSFSEVFDVYAFRIIVDKVDTSYRVLGVVHNLYKPVPGRFKDYIAIPKANGYQSLHTTLFSPYGVPIEVQIRTDDMDRFAEAGIAAHWLYKSGDHTGSAAHARALDWLRGLLELQRSAGNSLEFLEHVKIDLFPDEVYVFTPKGKILELPRGATAVDFAYAVHTDVGNTCVAVKINRHLMPLRTPLLNGQTVEIMTASGARPNPAWLNFVVTGKARANIRHYLKNLQRQEAVELGRRLLDKALDAFALPINTLPPARVAGLLEEFHLKSLDDLLDDIGLGNRMAPIVARQLAPALEEAAAGAPAGSFRARPLSIKGNEGMVVSLAKCCRPIPGDPILGFVSAGRGIVIHVQSCKNVAEFRHRPEKWVEVQWDAESDGEFPVEVRVDVTNQRGVLATVAAAIAEMGSNIENVGMEERDGMTSTLMFTITARDRRHLARIMRRVRAIKLVMRIARVRG
ncbi:MAG: bifunctional GTP diphosphokinase/guanosine-3',5'-bis(diphosphate) 3'-diphosphatase [Candidatus Muproteobacteria bacterium RBG_16_64_10]|uniref:Bifunctional GTP diphosphokinase/guanosine-3',5'-bis(Diphosphate) 3'-diphosphatase n=1 Tax=Candidatus Muproteobacteria bacterium RBG_16_64_10 TaxID=1817757 RepID=A0A1F6T3T2_9PROT|nr:MAG: bifunctional GTP diphosphokinase/guanosine-3',5'-bis(diphosphate) 3'-diphosphatase [Candidatus Muproteobacteria bacterium RBG_16_64_10]